MSLPNPGPTPVLLFISDPASGGIGPIPVNEANTDGNSAAQDGVVTLSYLYGFNGASWDRIRVANMYESISATADGSTLILSPGAGNAFRLMGYTISVAGTLAAAGILTIQLAHGATPFQEYGVALSTTASSVQLGADLGQGYLSPVAADDLNIILGSAMATGAVYVNAWGTIEAA